MFEKPKFDLTPIISYLATAIDLPGCVKQELLRSARFVIALRWLLGYAKVDLALSPDDAIEALCDARECFPSDILATCLRMALHPEPGDQC